MIFFKQFSILNLPISWTAENRCYSLKNLYLTMDNIKNIITIDPEILGGEPVFKNTRVPIETLFIHLEKGISLDEFLQDFPSVERNLVIAVIEIAGKLVSSRKLDKIYEITA